MSQLNHAGIATPEQQAQAQAANDAGQELQHVNDDAAAARHLTAIRIRGQLADADSDARPG